MSPAQWRLAGASLAQLYCACHSAANTFALVAERDGLTYLRCARCGEYYGASALVTACPVQVATMAPKRKP